MKKGVVSAGHELTVRAGLDMLNDGGNAFDAAVAASFASFVTEPALTSPAGGGFFVAHTAKGDVTLYDFFVDVPGRGRPADAGVLNFFSVFIDFADIKQELHIGEGSAAVPGNIAGLAEVYKKHCTLPLGDLLAPAIRYARDGIILNEWQAYFNDLLTPILRLSPEAQAIYAPLGKGLKKGDRIFNHSMAETLEYFSREGLESFYRGEIADKIIEGFGSKGLITREDLIEYSVKIREPLTINYRGRKIYTNPPPSSGGSLIAFALKLLEPYKLASLGHNSADYLELLNSVMRAANSFREAEFDRAIHEGVSVEEILKESNLARYREKFPAESEVSSDGTGLSGSVGGNTTQISVVDSDGNAASMTTSTGIGCGFMIPGTGIMMNNMLGEEDLNPMGFHAQSAGARMSSMMAPTMVMKGETPEIVLGSGGSKRIRSAILQVIINILDFDHNINDAVNASRVHLEDGVLQIEDGVDKRVIDSLEARKIPVNQWKEKNLYFGGVHSVVDKDGVIEGAGDTRRGGVSLKSGQ